MRDGRCQRQRRHTMRPVTDELLIGIAGVCATIVGLFIVGVFFFVETAVRQPDARLNTVLQPYMRASTRIVLVLFGAALALSLALVALTLAWATAIYVILSLILVASNVETAVRVRPVTKAIGARTLLVNEIVGTIAVLAIVGLPWLLGGWRPSREDLTLAALLALATAFVSVAALALFAFDMIRLAQPVGPSTTSQTAITGAAAPGAAVAGTPSMPADELPSGRALRHRPRRGRADRRRVGTDRRASSR